MATTTAKGMRGIHLFWWLCGFFAVMIAANAVFLYSALTSFPGEQVKNSYVLGLDYNREVERRRQQDALGWSAEVGLADAGSGRFVVRMIGADQAPLTGLVVSASVHVAGEAKASIIDLAEGAPGEYVAQIVAPAEARVETQVSARRRNEDAAVFQAAKTLVMP